jgi:hypothetical protein
MSELEIFFTFSFISALVVFFVTTGSYFLPKVIALYKIIVRQQHRQIPSKYALDELKFSSASDEES